MRAKTEEPNQLLPIQLLRRPGGAPRRLTTYATNHSTSVKANSVSWLKNGQIIFGGNENVTLMDQSSKIIVQTTKHQYVDCVREIGTGYLSLSQNGNKKSFQLLSNKLIPVNQKFSEIKVPTGCSDFTTTNDYIVVLNCGNHSIEVFDRNSHKRTLIIKTYLNDLRRIHALDDDLVVVSDCKEDRVCLYKLRVDAQPIWTYTGMEKPTCITSDEGENIYVASRDSKTIVALSMQG